MSEIVFMALSSGTNPDIHSAVVKTPSYDLKVVVVPNYSQAVETAKKLAREGVPIIELCAGFGHEGVAAIKKAVPKVQVGVVRFDVHPGMDNQSGDSVYGEEA